MGVERDLNVIELSLEPFPLTPAPLSYKPLGQTDEIDLTQKGNAIGSL
jgi:hypothetical protein